MNQKLKVAMARPLSLKRRAATLLLLAFVSLSTAWATIPTTDMNVWEGGPGYIHVRGWCFDPDATTTSLDVHVYVWKDAACTNLYTFKNVLAANESSEDVTSVYGVQGNHRFDRYFAVDDPGTYWIKVYAIDATGDSNPEMQRGGNGSPFQVTVTAPERLSQDGEGNYVIATAEDWNSFATQVAHGATYSGQTVKLTQDITVTTKVGRVSANVRLNPFCGTFDGGDHTLNVNITDNTTNQGAAPFSCVRDATIRNLTVTGTVNSTAYHAAAIVGFSEGTTTIKNCAATATVNGGDYVGGILGHGLTSNISIDSCVFAGLITGGTMSKGILFGWGDNGGTKKVSNSLYVMPSGQNTTNLDLGKHSAGSETYTNCYKTANVGSYGTLVLADVPANSIARQYTIYNTPCYDTRLCTVVGVNDSYTLTDGTTLAITPTVQFNGAAVASDNFTVTYSHNGKSVTKVAGSGTYTLTATGNGAKGYGGSWSKDFTVNAHYTITYDANGGTGAPEAQTKIDGEDLTLATSEPTREGYKFVGWSTSAIAHDYVDLGLPSNTLWATCNVGADNPEDYGKYYAWGETKAYGEEDETNAMNYSYNSSSTYVKTYYDWSMYKYCNGSYNSQTKYCTSSSYGTVDNKTVLEADDDAATVNWGGTWRMPTHEEWQELYNNTTSEWITLNGVNGRKFTASNGNYIFLPAAGYRGGTSLGYVGSLGYYWSASLHESYPSLAWYLHFYSGGVYPDFSSGRCYGQSVRPVTRDIQTYAAGATYTANAAVTLYAQWKALYTIAYDANGGENAPEAQTKIDGEDLTLATTVPTRTGFNFLGWNTMADGSGDIYAAGDIYTTDAAMTLYAQWQDIRERYTITYDANGGTGAPEAQTKVEGTDLTLATTVPTRNGYKFMGWKAVVDDGHEYVDLGLPSGLLWATCNIGATQSEEYGDYFAWGETTGYNSGKTTFNWSTYSLCNGSYNTLTKYNNSSSYGTVDNITTLDLADDAARANWGGDWRMPTHDEFTELCNNCTATWTTVNGVYGRLFTSNNNGNTLFLPAAGYRYDSSLNRAGSGGYYWSSSLYSDGPNFAWFLYFYSSRVDPGYYYRRYYGQSVRAVTKGIQTYAAGDAYTADAAATLYAQWEDIRERYTLTFDANGGTGAPEAQTKIKGEDLTLATTVPTREGYKFVRWKELNTHDYVDLGLSVLWATCNLGAEKSEDYGNYYVWGETEDKNSYGWETYKYCQGTENSITKYNDTDGLTELELADDAAYVNWGSAWRIPSEKEWQELVNNTESAWTTENGVNGYKFTASNGKYIFLPAAGAHSKSRLFDDGGQGHYASRTLKYPISMWQLNFVPTYVVVNYYAREYGYTVRPVTDGRDGTIYAAGGTYTTDAPATLYAQWELVPDGDGIYHIASIEDWNIFAEMVNNSVTFSGKVVKLDCNNIEVTTMVGTSSQKFEGTFDGCGNTLDINYSSSAQYCAPFSYVNNATFKDLNITGSITTSQKFAASIAGSASGTTTVTGCSSTVSITSSVGGDGTHGGFIGIAENNSTTNFTNCVFRGKLLGASTTYNGGFLGYVRSGSSSYTNCLFDPAELTMSTSGSCTFNRNTTPTMSGAYYTQTFGEAQGIQVFSEVPSKSLYKSLSIMGYNFFRTCDISGVNDFYECTGSAITPALSVKYAGTVLSADDYSVMFTHNGALANEVKDEGEYTMTVTGNEANGYCGTWSKTFKVCFGRDAEGNYIIANNDDWSIFASKITNGETFSGKTVKLASDEVTVTERVPSTFAGTFDGCGKTLTVNLSGGNEELAIFTTISNATIQNLHITGTINFARHRPASIASYVAGTSTVKNCWSDVDIISNYTPSSLDWVDGGALIARVNNGCTLNMSDCRFTGTFVYLTNNHEGGGMVGWTQDANATANLTNCLYAPTSLTMTKENTKQLTYIFVSGNKRGILTNCFYNGVAANTTVLKKEGTRVFDEPQTTLCKKVTLFGMDYYAQCDVLGVEDYYCYNEGQTIELDTKVFAGSDVMTSEDYTLTMTYNGASATEVKERGEYVITITGNNGNEVFGTWSKTFHVIGVDCDTDGNYVIANVDDWNTFVTMVANVESFSGKTVKLANSDITVTTMVGTESNPFCGTFDGGGNTLTFNYFTNEDNAAPFQWIKNAVIKDMTVTGKITTSGMFAAGFVAHAHGDNAIENCVSSVTILTGKAGDCMHGGFVGRIESDCKTFTFTDCLFSGTFDGSHNDNWCPFAAWSMGESNTNLVFNDCLYAPTSVNVRNGSATFYRNGTPTLNGAYYTQALGTVQGSQVFTEAQTTLYKKVTLFGTEYYAVCAISGVQTEYFWSEGKPVNVGLVVNCGGNELTETDYTVAYTCNGEAVDAVTTRGEYVVTVTGNEEAGCYGTATAHFTVLSDEDVFIVNYDLKDSYGDGWNGCAINVIEKASAKTVNTLTINDGKSASGELMLDAGKVYTFVWKAGSWASETSWTFNDGDGDLLFSGSGGSISNGTIIYQLLTSARPRNLNVTEPETGDFVLNWQSYEGHHDSWDVAYKSNTATDFTVVEGVTSNPYTLENLPVATEYTFKVRGRKDGLTTKWSDEVKFTMCEAITLANNATDNGATVTENDGELCNVTLANRTIYRDGDWNTLVLPFDVDLTDEDSPLYGATARTLASASLTNNGQTLTLNFDEPVNKLEAGVPYIIKWTEKCETDIVNPVFPYVTIDAADNTFCSDDRLVRFVGTYDLVTFDDENKDVLFLGGGNNLYYPDGKATTTIGACRAYFKIGNDDFMADAAQLRSIVMDFGEESETVTIENVRVTKDEEIWFTLDGRRANGDGRGFVVKTGSKRFVK